MSPTALTHPEWLVPLLSAVAACGVVLAASHLGARRRLRGLLGRRAPRPRIVPDVLLATSLLATAIALLGPRIGARTVRVPASGVDVVILFDVSHSMDATDTPPSRMARARRTAESVLAALAPGDRAALAAFGDHGVLLTPLSRDHEALREMVAAIDTDLMTDAGSKLWTGLAAALRAYDPAGLRPRELLVLSDGERSGGTPASLLDRLAAAQVRVVAVGIGSEAGGTIPTPLGELRDASGIPVVSRRDLAGLERIAAATGGAALAADRFGSVDTGELLSELHRNARPVGPGLIERRVPVSRWALPAALALLLLLAEGLPWQRRSGPSPQPGAPARSARWRRRGRAAPALVAAVLVPLGLGAAPEAPRAPDTGRAALERRVAERPGDVRSLIALGVAQARAGDRAEARRSFLAAAIRARRSRIAATAYYDLGVASLEDQHLAPARDAFLDAIALDPTDRRAKWNLEWTLRALRRSESPPGGRAKPSPDQGTPRPKPQRAQAAPKPKAPGTTGEARRRSPAESGRRAGPGRVLPRAGAAGAESNAPALRLDPEAVRHWLDAVQDDAGSAFQAAARAGGAGSSSRALGPRW